MKGVMTMKTAEEMYKEIVTDESLREEMLESGKDGFAEFLKNHDCMFTADEFREYMSQKREGMLDDDELSTVAGGNWFTEFLEWLTEY